MNLVDLPPEILLEIVYYVDTLHDILSLSLTNHALYNVLVPTHTEYFEIRCTIDKVNFWKHLQEHPCLCRRIRRLLLIQHHNRTRLPKPFDMTHGSTSAATSSEGFKLLCSLLPQMNNLKTFRSTALDTLRDASSFLAALTQSKCVLEELKFGYPKYAYNIFPNVVRISNWDFDWSRLSHLSFLLNSTTIAEGVLSKVLTGCPRLTELCFIVAPGLDISHILVQGRWPNLKRLGLAEMMVWSGIYYTTEDLQQRMAILRSFFSRHPLLEVVRLPAEIYPPGFFKESEDLFLNIKSLSLPKDESVPPSLASRLRHIYAGQWDAQWDMSFFSYLPNLQSCIINVQRLSNNTNVCDLTEYIPNVERLCFWSGGFRTTLDEIQKSAQICFHMKKLTTLFLSDFYFLDLTQEPDQLLVNKISQAIPSLKYINAYQNGQASLIRLTKDPVTAAYRGFQYVSPMPTVAEIAEQWGNFLFYNSNAE